MRPPASLARKFAVNDSDGDRDDSDRVDDAVSPTKHRRIDAARDVRSESASPSNAGSSQQSSSLQTSGSLHKSSSLQKSGSLVARQAGERLFWLAKVEPAELTIAQLAASPNQTTRWEGVRNHEAKKNLQAMKLGDEGSSAARLADAAAVG